MMMNSCVVFFMHLNIMRVNTCHSSEPLSWDRRCGGKLHHRVKGTVACVSWCVASRNERGGRQVLARSCYSCSFLPAAARDERLALITDHVPRALAASGSAAGSSPPSLPTASPFSHVLTAALTASFSPLFPSHLPLCRAWELRETGGGHRQRPIPPRSLLLRPGRAGHGGPCDGEGAVADGQVHASAYLEPGRAPLRHFGPDGGLHRLLLPPLHLRLRPALAGPAVPTQALQLPDRVPVPVPAVVGPAHRALLLLLQELCHCQHSGALSLLATLLLSCLPPVLHTQPHEPLLCTGELWSRLGTGFHILNMCVKSLNYYFTWMFELRCAE